MAQAKQGDRVKVHYTGRLRNGEQFDSSEGREPLSFVVGEGTVIPGFENAIVGMNPGDKKTIEIPAEEAYGPYREEMVAVVDRKACMQEITPVVGMDLELCLADNQRVRVRVKAFDDVGVTLDANHFLAGQDLIFDLELVSIG